MIARILAGPLGRWSEPLLSEPAIVATVLKWLAVLLRLFAGYFFVLHGYDKLFNGDNWYAMPPSFFEAAGIPFPELNHVLIGALELFGGLALIAGFLTRIFAFLLGMTMLVAMLTVGTLATELPLFIACAILVFTGGGMLSVDQLLDQRMARPAARPR